MKRPLRFKLLILVEARNLLIIAKAPVLPVLPASSNLLLTYIAVSVFSI